jgi:hypothetical protein
MGEREVVVGGDEGDQALRTLAGAALGALAVLLAWAPAGAAPPAYCNGQTITTDSGVHYYPNGQRVVDGFGKQYYPNGARIVNDAGDEVRYPDGSRVRTMTGDVLFPSGTPVKSSTGEVRYPSGRATRDSGGRCYHETGVEMTPCQRSVGIRQRLAGGVTAAYALDIVEGTIDLTSVRFRFPSAGVTTVLEADLAAGRIDGGSITAACGAGAAQR